MVGLLLAASYPLMLKANLDSVLVYVPYFTWIILAESWNIAGGYAGLLNLGLVGSFALGAFTSAFSLSMGYPLIASMLLGGLSEVLFKMVAES